MDKCTVLCNEYHHECMHVSVDGLINEVCMHLTSMVDFDWLDVLLGSAFMSVLACALLAKNHVSRTTQYSRVRSVVALVTMVIY